MTAISLLPPIDSEGDAPCPVPMNRGRPHHAHTGAAVVTIFMLGGSSVGV